MCRISLLLIAFLTSLFLFSCTRSEEEDRPNIVWITSEDNSVHYMKLYSESGVATPNIASLAEHGVLFTNAFSNAPVCSVARSTLISACYGPRVGSNYHRKLKTVPMPEGIEMFPAYLKKAGYFTSNNNKEDYNFFKGDKVWDESSGRAHWRNRSGNQAFFYMYNIMTTHESRLHFTEEDMNKTVTKTKPDTSVIFPNHPHTDLFAYTNAYYRDKVVQMDQEVADIVHELEEDGLLESTIIFYFGDHGGVLPGSKGYIYETGLHVPLVVYIPDKYKKLVGYKPGSQEDAFVSFVDFGPTVLKLAGAEIPEGIDGKAFMGKKHKGAKTSDVTYAYADRFDEKCDMVRSVRAGKYKYIRSYQPFNFDGLMNNYRYQQLAYQEWQELFKNGKLNQIESQFYRTRKPELLFDLESDPYECKDISDQPEAEEVLQMMRDTLDKWEMNMPDLSFYPEHHLIKYAFENPVAFGQEHKEDIEKYITISNYIRSDFPLVKDKIITSLLSEDPWERYWGLIVCSIFLDTSSELVDLAENIASNDNELLNRVRAAEFLGLSGQSDPSEVMIKSLYSSTDGNEALLILNSIVLMKSIFTDYKFDINTDNIQAEVLENSEVQRRISYLCK